MSSENGKNGSEVHENQSNNGVPSSKENDGADNSNNASKSPSTLKVPSSVHSSPSKGSSPDISFEHLDPEDAIRENTFTEVMKKMISKHHNLSKDREDLVFGKCKVLFEKDYECKIVHNNEYTKNYPVGILVPLRKKTDNEGSRMDFDDKKYAELVCVAPEARLRSRFIAPVILFDNKYICRSGTLSVKLSACYEVATKAAPPRTLYDEDEYGILRAVADTIWNLGSAAYQTFTTLIDWKSMFTLFNADVDILEHLKVERVCDLMVEYSKLYKQTISVSSTEKAHETLYTKVKLEEMPFPGCEFFVSYHEAGRNAKDLRFDWKQSDVTRGLQLTKDLSDFFPEINVNDHKEWDLVALTQNYLKIMLSYIVTDTGGILVHCISGWDRTPLFISLLRMSLWADGLIHENLGCEDFAYLTVAYDWFLFGHNLPDRHRKKEEVMHFCFNFLEHITSDEFSVTRLFKELPEEEKRGRTFPEFIPGRRLVLNKIRTFVLDHYNEIILENVM